MAENGKRLLALMLRALGMDSGAKNFPPPTGSGSITSYAEGKQSDWNFDLAMGLPSPIQMTADNLIYQCSGQKCSEVKRGNFPGTSLCLARRPFSRSWRKRSKRICGTSTSIILAPFSKPSCRLPRGISPHG